MGAPSQDILECLWPLAAGRTGSEPADSGMHLREGSCRCWSPPDGDTQGRERRQAPQNKAKEPSMGKTEEAARAPCRKGSGR